MHEPSIPAPCHTVSSQPYLELTWIQFDTTSQSQVPDCPLASYLESGKYIDHNKQNQTWCFKLSNFHTKHFYLHKSISRVWFFGLNCSRLGNLDCGCFGIITNSYPRNLLLLRHLIRVIRKHDPTEKKTKTMTMTMTMITTMTKTNTFREHLQRAILETCDLWDIWSEGWGNMTWPTKRQ